jgi:hypothetical protein
MKLFKNQRGDTIMEVLICVAVLSFVLSAAFALANRSSQANLQAGERGEAMKISESQVEKLKAFIGQSVAPVIPASGDFCMYVDTSTNTLKTLPVATPDDLTSYPSECRSGAFYNTYINRSGNVYTAHTRWFSADGDGYDESTMVYKVYPDTASAQASPTLISGCNAPLEYMNSLGGCVPCGAGYQNLLGAFSQVPCSAITPTITVNVQKIPPDSGNNTPACTKAGSNANGVAVILSGNAASYTGTSTATFANLAFNKTYTTSLNGTPAGFEYCGPPNSTTTATTTGPGTYPVNNHTLTLKIRPLCYTASVFDYNHWHNDWHDHGFNHEHGYYQTTTWWQHTGTDGRHSEWNTSSSPYSTQPNIFERWEGPVYVRYERVGSTYSSSGPWYNRFENWSNTTWVKTEDHWHSDLHDHGFNHPHYKNVPTCPT